MCLCMNPPPSGFEADTVLSECSVSSQNICCHRPRLSSSVCIKAQSYTSFSGINKILKPSGSFRCLEVVERIFPFRSVVYALFSRND